MKILVIIIVVCMVAFGIVGAIGFFSDGFTNFDKEGVKQQLNSLKESVQGLTDKVGDAFRKDKQPEDATPCEHANIDENGMCQDCGKCTHKYGFNGVCQGCGKSLDEIRAECEHEFDGCVCTKCGYTDHDVDPDTFQCRKCGMLVINTNSACLNGHDLDAYGDCKYCHKHIEHRDVNGDGHCDSCGVQLEVQPEPEPEPEPEPQEKYIVSIHQQNVPTYQVGDEAIPESNSIMLVYSDDSYDFAIPDSIDVDTSTPGDYMGVAYYGEFTCEFSYTVEGTEEGPTGSGESMVEEDGEW